jgi:putative hydrolase of the HAD superfamily
MSDKKHPPIEPAKIRAAVFDLGGVLINGGPGEVIAFGERTGLDAGAWQALRRDIFGNEGTWAKLERGEVTLAEFAGELRKRVLAAGGDISESESFDFMGTHDPMSAPDKIRDEMLDAVRRLKTSMPTALLTNNVAEWRNGWTAIFDDDTLFDVVIDSSAVGARKPEAAIYEHTQERLAVAHEEIFFLDDIGQNLKAARALGWQTLLFTSEAEVLPVLHELHEANNVR